MSPKSPSEEYEEQMIEEDEFNKLDSKRRSEASIRKFYTELTQQTKRDPPKEKQYRKSILTEKDMQTLVENLAKKAKETKKAIENARQRTTSSSTNLTKKGGKRRKPRKTKKHRKKKSL